MKSCFRSIGFGTVAILILASFQSCDSGYRNSTVDTSARIERISQQLLLGFDNLSTQENPDTTKVNNLLILYTDRYLKSGGLPVPELEDFLIDHCRERAAGYAFVNLVRNGISGKFISRLQQKAKGGNEAEDVLFYHAGLLYETSLLGGEQYLSTENAAQIIKLMEEARDLRRTWKYNDLLAEAYRVMGMHRELFDLGAYLFVDLGEEGLYSRSELRRLHNRIAVSGESINDGLARAENRVKNDMDRWAVSVPEFILPNEFFITEVSDERSNVTITESLLRDSERPLALAVFTTDCPYCITELKALTRLFRDYGNEISILALRKPDLENPEDDMALDAYAQKYRIKIPLLENNNGTIFTELDVGTVPVLYLFDADGRLNRILRFQSQANLEMKIRWYLDELANR